MPYQKVRGNQSQEELITLLNMWEQGGILYTTKIVIEKGKTRIAPSHML